MNPLIEKIKSGENSLIEMVWMNKKLLFPSIRGSYLIRGNLNLEN